MELTRSYESLKRFGSISVRLHVHRPEESSVFIHFRINKPFHRICVQEVSGTNLSLFMLQLYLFQNVLVPILVGVVVVRN